MHRPSAALGLLLSAGCAHALDLDLNDANSIKSAGKTIVSNIVSLYGDASTPGIFPKPYYWWEGGLAFDSLINYWALTGDESYVNLTRDALLWQVSPTYNYLPPNQTSSEGNDEQSTWGLAAMTAAERQFPAPTGNVSWVQLAQNVFDSQAARWDSKTCDGGLRWQIFTFNNGYNYKNSLSNGNFAQLAARLARYTGNQTYSDWVSKTVSWSQSIGLITSEGNIFDGATTTVNCSQLDHVQWTAASGTYLTAAAYMSNITTNDSTWSDLLASVFKTATSIYVESKAQVLFESACAPQNNCDVDQLAFRAVLARALANVLALTAGSSATANGTSAAALRQQISALVQSSATGAAAQCSGGSNKTVCGSSWNSSTWDGSSGLGQDLSALEIILANLPTTELATANSTTGPSSSSSATNSTAAAATSPSGTSAAAQPSNTSGASGLAAPMLVSLLGLCLAAVL